MSLQLVSLQGSTFMAPRDSSGNPGVLTDVGDQSVLQISAAEQTAEYREHKTGNRNLSDVLSKSTTAEVKLTLGEWLPPNLALGLHGTSSDVTGTTVAAEALPTGLVQNDIVRLDNPGISALTIKDSASTPATLVEGTDYKIIDAAFGRIQFISVLTGFTQPFTAGYTFANYSPIALLGTQAPIRWLRFEGFSTAASTQGQKYLAELYKVRFAPISKPLDLVNQDYGEIELTGQVLYDETRAADAVLGQFGRLIPLG